MAEENKWYGLSEVDYIYHNSWSDPELVYKNWHFNAGSLETALWNEYEDLLGIKDNDYSDTKGFSKFVQNNSSYVYEMINDIKNASRVADSLDSFGDMIENNFKLQLSNDYKEALYSAFKMSMDTELDLGLYEGYGGRIYIGNEDVCFSDSKALINEAFLRYDDSILDEIVHKILGNSPNGMSKDEWCHTLGNLIGADDRVPSWYDSYDDMIYWQLRSNAENYINDLARYAGRCNDEFRKSLFDLSKGNILKHFFDNVIQNKEHCINQEIFDKATESFKSVQKKLKPVSRPGYAIAGISSR